MSRSKGLLNREAIVVSGQGAGRPWEEMQWQLLVYVGVTVSLHDLLPYQPWQSKRL